MSDSDPGLPLTTDDVRRLLELFAKPKSSQNDRRVDDVQQICVRLFAKDYPDSLVINNDNGELASTYPSKIIIPQETIIGELNGKNGRCDEGSDETVRCESMLTSSSSSTTPTSTCHTNSNGKRSPHLKSKKINTTKIDANKLKDLISRARVARCRARFPVPIFVYNGKYVCRSSTLSGGPEIYGRSGLDYLFTNNSEAETPNISPDRVNKTPSHPTSSSTCTPTTSADSNHLFSRVRNQDIKLLKYLSVGNICDLMVEKKKVKFGVNVTSSEKADKESRYSEFNIMSLPYPGCEFFRDFRDNSYSAEGLIYDWNQHFVDAHLIVPHNDRIYEHQLLFDDSRDVWTHRAGSSTSLNSSCSTTSNRSQDPPKYFPVYLNNEDNVFQVKSESYISGKTPPTLTNSEEGSAIFSNSDMISTITNTSCGSNTQTNSNSSPTPSPCTLCSANSITCTTHSIPPSNGFKSTQPVAIPSSVKKLANCDAASPTLSGSALSRSDSWQLVSDTGSIRDFILPKNSFNSPDSLSSTRSNINENNSSSSGSSELKRSPRSPQINRERDRDVRRMARTLRPEKTERLEKLQTVRSIFYNAYSSAIGFKFKNGTEAPVNTISTLIDHFAGSVGIYSNRITSPTSY
ncbi:unnamed protein product [Sphagnum balticum]